LVCAVVSGLAIARPASANCAGGSDLVVNHGVPAACNAVCAWDGITFTWACNVTVLAAGNPWTARMVTDAGGGRGLCGWDYCAWGADGAGNTFCCGTNNEPLITDLIGGSQPDALALAWLDGIHALNYDLDDFGGDNNAAYVHGWDGNDTILGSRVWTATYLDILLGGNQADTIRGQDGNDIMNGGNNVDNVYGDLGNDMVCGGPGNDNLFGNDGLDALWDIDAGDALDGGAPAGFDACGDCALVGGCVGCTGALGADPGCPI
jgi:Ca2+-binding RTX toxin-like protein